MTASQPKSATLVLDDKSVQLPVLVGSEGEHAIDIEKLRSATGYITLDEGYRSTGSCKSAITFIDGEKGILRYRGYPIEQIAQHSSFIETAWLIIWGELPTQEQLQHFRSLLTEEELLHEALFKHFDGFPANAPPMAILSSMINASSTYDRDLLEMESEATFELAAARLLSKVRTIAAAAYKASIGHPLIYPKPEFDYCKNFLHMMFSIPNADFEPSEEMARAMNLIFLLHADHEQNCSTSTVRMVASSGANLFASCSAGVCALWGWRHGGANVEVIKMLEQIQRGSISTDAFMDKVKRKEAKLMGFGHRIYKSYDPRATILRESAETLLSQMKKSDPLLDIARRLQDVALNDSYFKERNLYPNVDFYSGIILRAIGIPLEMFTVMFAIGRMPGWIANYREVWKDPELGIYRPRQVYTGETTRDFVPMKQRTERAKLPTLAPTD
jgi:citrate synthase